MPIPSHLQPYVQAGSVQQPDSATHQFSLAAPNGRTRFQILYHGTLFEPGSKLLVSDEKPLKVVAREPESGLEILLFDEAAHGYNAMLCDEFSPDDIQNRPLKPLDDALYALHVTAYYGIDYEEEREDFVGENGMVTLINGSEIDFARLKQDGMDAFAVELENAQGQREELLNLELA